MSAVNVAALDTTLPSVVSSENKTWKIHDTRHELGLRTGVITKLVPLPVITDDDFVITGAETVITTDETVITDADFVITANETEIGRAHV